MRIQGLGVIEDAVLELDPGFTVITGETGAGKTMVVSGLHLLSGGRSHVSKLRAGTARAAVEGRFDDITGPATRILSDAGAEVDEDGSVIALRAIGSDGRSRTHLGGRSVPVGVLADLSEQLLAVHGQNDQLRLLRPAEQRTVLDRFAGAVVAGSLADYRRVREEWLAVAEEFRNRSTHSRELAQQADLLRHGIAEIEAVDPAPGEDNELAEQVKRLTAADELREVAAVAQRALAGSVEGSPDLAGALEQIAQARRRLAGAEDPVLRELEPRLSDAAALLGDVSGELTTYLETLDADPERLEQILARQAELKQLTRKYAADIDGVLVWAQDARRQLSGMDVSEEALARLASRRDELADELAGHAGRLSAARSAAAQELAAAITAELAGLAMGQAQIEIAVRPRPAEIDDPHGLRMGQETVHAGADGVDEVELLLRAHADAPALPVHKAASGGELSRVMLAIEVVLAHAATVRTLVFDEVDAGVGGRAAGEIGKRLAMLARNHQVLVVTHLPQVAAFADRHLVVDKGTAQGVTRSDVKVLAQSERVAELARMLAGMDDTETGRAHAEELLSAAERFKESAEPGPWRDHFANDREKNSVESDN